MATLKEIAREAGVSVSTVSLVVNGKPCVSQDKRQRVIEIIRARKYVPNYAARALRKRHAARTYAIGVLTPAPLIAFSSSSHVYRIIAGAEQAVKQKKYHLVLGSLEPLAEGIFHLPRMLEAGEVDGILIISTAALEMEKIVGSVASFSTPVVLCGYPGQDFNLPSVLIDNEKAAYEATLALLKSGYPKVATITGPLSYPSAAARLRGYRLALVENGLFPDETLVEEGDFSELSGAEAMKRLLRHLTPPFGVFVAGDFMAKGALNVLAASGVRVPEQAGVFGFDDVEYVVQSTKPALSSVRAPWEEVGRQAVSYLLALPSSGTAPPTIMLPCELKVRGSSNPNGGGSC